MNIIDSSKVNKLEEELELTKIQLEQAFKERAAEERIHKYQIDELEKENKKLKKIIQQLDSEKGILLRAMTIINEGART